MTCDGCLERFVAEGKQTICDTCLRNGFSRRTCECGTPFDTRDLGRWKCCFCADSEDHAEYAQSRPLYESADYRFDPSTDT